MRQNASIELGGKRSWGMGESDHWFFLTAGHVLRASEIPFPLYSLPDGAMIFLLLFS